MAVKNGKVAPSSDSSHSDSLVDTLESGYQMRRQEHAENRLLVPQTVKWMCSKILPRLGTADEMEIYVEKANFKEGDLRSRLFRLGDVRWQYKDGRSLTLTSAPPVAPLIDALCKMPNLTETDAVRIINQVIEEVERRCTLAYAWVTREKVDGTFGERKVVPWAEVRSLGLSAADNVLGPFSITPPAVESVLRELRASKSFLRLLLRDGSKESPTRTPDALGALGQPVADNLDSDLDSDTLSRIQRLASICLLFGNATQNIQLKAWSQLSKCTRNQWALFLIEADPKSKKIGSKTEAVDKIVKPFAKQIEAISGRTNMRTAMINERSQNYSRNLKKVTEIIKVLAADAVLQKTTF